MGSSSVAEVSEELLQEVVRLLVVAGGPDAIILFGSRAKGIAKPDSDIDLLVIDPAAEESDRAWVYHDALAGIRIPKNITLESGQEVASWRNVHNHFLTTLIREGRVLYERTPGLMSRIGPAEARRAQNHESVAVNYVVTEEQIQEIVRDMAEVGSPLKIILFGSRATGTERPDSDVDILVIDAESAPSELYGRLSRSLPGPVDVIVRTPEEVAAWRDVPNHFLTKIVREGRVLYERPSDFRPETVPANDYADHAREILRFGDEDIETAELLVKAGTHSVGICFHLQRAIERYLKAILAYDGADIPRSHNLERLRYLVDRPPRLLEIDPRVDLLSPFATNASYGENLRASTEFVASAALLARKVRDVVARELPLDPHA